jgi:fatty acid desaturase
MARAVDVVVHRRQARRIERVGTLWDEGSQRIPPQVTRALGPLPLDDVLAPCLVIALHGQLLLLAWLVGRFPSSLPIAAVACLIAATRMRSLQEITHYSVHGSLTFRRHIGLRTAGWLFQFPLWRATIEARVKHHALDHHPHVNDPVRDPNLIEYAELGFIPPLRWRQLVRLWLYPLTVHGVLGTVRSAWRNFCEAPAPIAVCAAAMVVLLLFAGGPRAVLVCYGIPLLLLYPLLAWWSQLVEHRWFEVPTGPTDEREYASGRVLNVSGPTRWWLEATVLPFGDSLHLAHSIYPGVRWNYLPLVHRLHMQHDRRYRAVALELLWQPRHPRSIVGDVVRNFSRAAVMRP